MFNRSEILRSAWAAYRRDDKSGFVGAVDGFRRFGSFDRPHFAYCLRMAWAIARECAAKPVARRAALIAEAGRLNNHPALFNVDHVTFMGFLDLDECERHVAKLRDMVKSKLAPAAAARAASIRAELLDQEFASRIDWTRRSNLSAELAVLTA